MLTSLISFGKTIPFVIAPMFLLAGLGSFLNVMTTRIGRVADRSINLESKFLEYSEKEKRTAFLEFQNLEIRMRYANRAIVCCVSASLLLCLMVSLLFLSDIVDTNFLRIALIACFVCTVILTTSSLFFFLLEIRHAIKSSQRRNLALLRKLRIHFSEE